MNLDLGASFWARVELTWSELGDWLRLPLASSLPLPVPTGTIGLDVFVDTSVGTSPDATPQLRLRCEADYEIDPAGSSLLGFTFGRTVHFTFATEFMPAAELDPSNGVFEGTMALELAAKLPAFPHSDVFRVSTGDAEGWTTFRLEAWVVAGDASGVRLRAEILNPFELSCQLPGLLLPEPPLRLALERLGGEVSFLDEKLSGALEAEGSFMFAPRLTLPELPLADLLEPLLRHVSLAGKVKFVLALSQSEATHRLALEGASGEVGDFDALFLSSVLLAEENPEFALCAVFRNADIELQPFQLLRRALQVPRLPADELSQIGMGVRLSGFCVRLSREPSFAIEMAAHVAGIDLPASLKVSRTELQLGLGRALPGSSGGAIKIPLKLPRISRKEFGFIEGSPINGYTRRARGALPIDKAIYDRLSKEGRVQYDSILNLYFDVVEQITGAVPRDDQILIAYQQGEAWKVRPPAGVTFDDDAPFRLVAGCVGVLKEDGSLERTGEPAVVCHVKDGDAWHVILAKPALQLDGFYFSFPFQNPRNIRVGGTARFIVDGPFHEISKLAVTVGLSADMVYFSIDVDGTATIEIPEFIPGYSGGSVSLAKLMFGFGYTKRSLAVAFAGELKLPEKLVDDLDTSDELGAGIRLPVQSKLAFQFDLIPLVLGKFVIPVPMFQFNWDLRRDGSPGLRDPRTCEPYWDGLQLIIPDVIRVALKRISYNPILALYASSNSDFDGDLVLGDEANGLSIIADNIFWAYGLDSGLAIACSPINGLPFADNFCISVRLAGFRLNFNLQRPIPSFSPMALFEVLALLSDPFYEIAPRGELADTVRVSLTDAWLVLPEEVRRLFPQTEALTHKTLNVTINMATYLKILQRIAKTLKPVAESFVEALKDPDQATAGLRRRAAALASGDLRTIGADLLALLPPELRKLRAEVSFAGFEGSAVLVLTDRKGAIAALQRREQAPPPAPPPGSPTPPPDWRKNPRIRSSRDAPRMADPEQPQSNVLLGAEFAGFTQEDLDAIAPPLSDSLFEPGDITPPLVARLQSDSGALSTYLRGRCSSRLHNVLALYGGGLPTDELRRALARELNVILKGRGLAEPCIYTPTRFAGVALGPQIPRMLERHKREPLEGVELQRLNRALLEAAYASELPATTGVLVGARVRIFEGQRFRFIGFIFDNGAFSLVSSAHIEPLELSVAGIPVRLPFEFEGRLQLTGRVKRDGFSGSVLGEGFGTWNIAPGLLLVTVGSKETKATLELFSDGAFAFAADGAVTLFNNPECRLSATVEVSNTHCFVSGTLDLQCGWLDETRLFELHASAKGRIGPKEQFRVEFATEIASTGSDLPPSRFLGIPLGRLRGAISESGAELEATFTQGKEDWILWPGPESFMPKFRMAEAVMRGRLNPRKSTVPDFALEGALTLQLFDEDGPSITGRGGLSSKSNQLHAFVEGALHWQGRDWLRGRLEVRPEGARISGEVSLVLSPPLPNTHQLQLAQLVVSVELSGQFFLKAAGGISRIEGLRARCILGIRFPPGSNPNSPTQPIPLAMVEVVEPGPLEIAAPAAFRLELLRVDTLLPSTLRARIPKPRFLYGETPVKVPTGAGWDTAPSDTTVPVLSINWSKFPPLITGSTNKTVVGTAGTPKLTFGDLQVPTGIDLNNPTETLSFPLQDLFPRPFTVWLKLKDATGRAFDLEVSS
jgi:hypothetical protein